MTRDEFIEAVHEVVKMIPSGRATSYGLIAKAIGCPTMQRKVGKVLSTTHSSLDIPAHRVVNSQGILSGRAAFSNLNEMQERLESEGIVVVNNKIKNWKSVCWNPLEEIY